jgi:hypothetical protein
VHVHDPIAGPMRADAREGVHLHFALPGTGGADSTQIEIEGIYPLNL